MEEATTPQPCEECNRNTGHAGDCPENPQRGVYAVRPGQRAPPPAPPEVRAAWKEKDAEEDALGRERSDKLRRGEWPPKKEDADEKEDGEEDSDQDDSP